MRRSSYPRTAQPLAGLALVAFATALLFVRALGNGFVNFDDDAYITENPRVAAGLTLDGVHWAFTGVLNSNWHPLTWISHMADVSLFGMAPWGHHLGNLVLHGLNTGLILVLLRRWGLGAGVAVVATLLWAWHPLRVESVAWAAERKDVLSAFFGLLSLVAYDAYARRGGLLPAAGAFVALGLGLLAKPMLVTWPCVFLVLDMVLYQRASGRWGRVLLEKLPYAALVAGSVAATLWAQRGAMQSLNLLSPMQRLCAATQGYGAYLFKTVFPYPLTPLYPLDPTTLTPAHTALPALLLVALSAALLWRWRGSLAAAGWLLFLGMLVPVSGLVQVGNQAYADRYTYLPGLGLAMIVGAALQRAPRAMWAVAVLLLPLAGMTWMQIGLWRDSGSLFAHTVAHTGDNSVARNNLGKYLVEQGRLDEAIEHLKESVRIAPTNTEAHYNLGCAYLLKGDYKSAVNTLGPLGPWYQYEADFNVNLALALHGAGASHFPIAANNALLLLPPDAPARAQLEAMLKAWPQK